MITIEKDVHKLLDELQTLRREKARWEARDAELARAEKALRLSEERFRTLFEQSPVSMQVFAPDGRTLKVNRAYEALWGVTLAELKNYNMLQDRELVTRGIMPYVRKAFAGQATEIPVVTYNPAAIGIPGRLRSVKAFIYPVKDEAGAIVQVVLMHVDVTDMVKAQAALRESQQQLQAIMDNSLAVIYMKDAEGRYVLFNRRFEELSHAQRGTDLGKTDYDFYPPAVAESFRAYDQKVLETGKPEEREETVPREDGLHTYISVKYPLLDDRGVPYAVCGISTDITDRKKAEDALRRAQRFTERVLNTTPDIVYVYDLADRRNVYVNRQTEKSLGYSPDEIRRMGSRFFENLLHPDDREKSVENTRRLAAAPPGTIAVIEYRMRTADGQWRWFLGRHTVFTQNEDGTPREILGAATDITERKRDREQLKESNEKLQETMMNIINAVSRLVEMRDPYTAGHQRHVSQLSSAIAREMGFSAAQVERIRVAGLIHDFGKIFVPSEILSKPGRLSPPEFAIIKTHPEAGFEFLQIIHFPWPVAEVAHLHHERLDGSGYPKGLKGRDIPLEIRIVSVADVVEAMGFSRPYRPNIGLEKALAEIERGRGKLFDPAVVDTCLNLFRRHRFHFDDPASAQ